MRKISILSIVMMVSLLLSSCGTSSKSYTKDDLTELDYQYLDAVYNSMSMWDIEQYDSGEFHYINKISFFDFDGTGNLCFYINYPITAYYGRGYFVSTSGINAMNFSAYETDSKSRSSGWLMQTSMNGTDWDHSTTSDNKYETIVKAYISYLNTK